MLKMKRQFGNSVECFEFVRKERAKWLLDNLDTYPAREQTDPKYNGKKVITDYLKEILKTKNGVLKRKYFNNGGIGRMHLKEGQIGFQKIMREYRAFLCYLDYYDLDIVNAQPIILYNICREYKMDTEYIDKYIEKRDIYVKQLQLLNPEIEKDKVKDYLKKKMMSIINGSKYLEIKEIKISDKINKFIENFKDEIEYITKEIFEKEENKIFINDAKIAKEKNIEGTAMAYFLQNWENTIIQLAKIFLKKKGYDISALVFDGLMIRNNIPLGSKILKELNRYIEEWTNIKIEFIIKPFCEVFEPNPDELKIEEEIIVDSDAEAKELIMNKFDNMIVKCDGKYYIRKYKNTNIYYEDKTQQHKESKTLIFQLVSSIDIKISTNKGYKEYTKNTSGCESITTYIFKNLKQTDKFTDLLFESNIHKLCFLNGYYDIKSNSFKEYDGSTFTTKYINKNYVQNISKQANEYLNKKILNPILGEDKEYRTYFFRWFSRALFGCMDKKWAVGLGNRNTGKSVLTKLFELSFDNYVEIFNSESLMATKVGSGDVYKKLSWIVPLKNARLYLSNELRTIDDSGKGLILDGNVIKSISSGIDTTGARQNYENESKFQIQGNMCLFMNDLCKVDPIDTKENLYQFNFNNIFVKELTKEHDKINKEGDGCKYHMADDHVKELIKDIDIQNAFINLIIESYGNNIKNIIDEDYNETNDDDASKILEHIDITLNKKDRIPVKDINQLVIDNCIKITKSQLILLLTKKGVGRATFPNEGKVYTGIKLIEKA